MEKSVSWKRSLTICLCSFLLFAVLPFSAYAYESPDDSISNIAYDLYINIYDADGDIILSYDDYRVGVNDSVPILWIAYDENHDSIEFLLSQDGYGDITDGSIPFNNKHLGGEVVGISERENGYEQNLIPDNSLPDEYNQMGVLLAEPLSPALTGIGMHSNGTYEVDLYVLRLPSVGDELTENNNTINNGNLVINNANDAYENLTESIDYINQFNTQATIDLSDIVDSARAGFGILRSITELPYVSTMMSIAVVVGVAGFVLYGRRE